MKILCIEERDASGSAGFGTNCGWTHYFEWPSMRWIRKYLHQNNNNRNDSGQSYCEGSQQYQVNCICTLSTDNINFIEWDKHTNTVQKERVLYYANSGNLFRQLGITKIGNVFILGGLENVALGAFEGLAKYHLGDTKVWGMASGWIPSGIAKKGNQIYSVCQDDYYLRIHQAFDWDDSWKQVESVLLPDGGANNFRGCSFWGNQILVGNETNHRIYVIQDQTWETVKYHDISSYMSDPGNLMPYGLWFWN